MITIFYILFFFLGGSRAINLEHLDDFIKIIKENGLVVSVKKDKNISNKNKIFRI